MGNKPRKRAHAAQTPASDLSRALEILLGRGLSSFDDNATYALYHWDDTYQFEFPWKRVNADEFLRPERNKSSSSADGLKKDNGSPYELLGWDRYEFDLGRSYFFLEASDFSGEQADALAEKKYMLSGNQLGEFLHDYQVQRDSLSSTIIIPRVQTDGTLFDAMRAATWTMGGSKGLVTQRDEDAEVDSAWMPRLEAIEDTVLRYHIGMLCQDAKAARCIGAHYEQAQVSGLLKLLETHLHHTAIATWSFGEGQAAAGVFRLSLPSDGTKL